MFGTIRIISYLLILSIFSACEYYVQDADKTQSIDPSIQVSESSLPLENEVNPDLSEDNLTETETATFKILASMTNQDEAFIETKMDEYDIAVGDTDITRDHVFFIYAIDSQTQEFVSKIKKASYTWKQDNSAENLGKLLEINRELKVRIATLLTVITPDHDFEQPQDDGKFGAEISKEVPLFGVILDALIETLEQISLSISYNVDGECKAFFFFANPVNEAKQERGYLNYIDCESNKIFEE